MNRTVNIAVGSAINLGSCTNCNFGGMGFDSTVDRSEIKITEFDMHKLTFRLCEQCKKEVLMSFAKDQGLESLTKKEMAIVQKHRDKVAQDKFRQEFKLRAIDTAKNFLDWITENGAGTSYSTFVDEFGYQGDDAKLMYDAVSRILTASNPNE